MDEFREGKATLNRELLTFLMNSGKLHISEMAMKYAKHAGKVAESDF